MVEKTNTKEVTEAMAKMEISAKPTRVVWQKKEESTNQNVDPNLKETPTPEKPSTNSANSSGTKSTAEKRFGPDGKPNPAFQNKVL